MQDRYETAPSYSPPPASSPQWRSGFANQHGPTGRDGEEEHVLCQCRPPRRGQYIWKSIWNVSVWILSLSWYQIDLHLQLGVPGPMFFPCQQNHRKRGDSLTPRGQVCGTQPIISKACPSISSAASNLNLANKEIVITKMRTCLRNGYLKISPGQSLFTSDSTIWEQLKVQRCQDSTWHPPGPRTTWMQIAQDGPDLSWWMSSSCRAPK